MTSKSRNLTLSGFVAIVATLFTLGALPAVADESPFGYTYTTDSLPQGKWEFEQWNTLRSGKARGTYTSLDFKSEIELGITNDFSAALYLKSSYLHLDNVYDPENVENNLPDGSRFAINGTSLELKYRVLSPYKDPLGLSLYFEPELGVRDQQTGQDVIERAFEAKLILQKNFFDDLMINAMNIMFEPEWEIAGEEHARELWFELMLASSYRIYPNWTVGLELRNHREYPDMDFGKQEHSAWFLGPSVHYGVEKWWATFTVLPQLAGSPQVLGTDADGNVISDSTRHLGQHEKLEVRLKIGINL